MHKKPTKPTTKPKPPSDVDRVCVELKAIRLAIEALTKKIDDVAGQAKMDALARRLDNAADKLADATGETEPKKEGE